jgi:hypothetical protein
MKNVQATTIHPYPPSVWYMLALSKFFPITQLFKSVWTDYQAIFTVISTTTFIIWVIMCYV